MLAFAVSVFSLGFACFAVWINRRNAQRLRRISAQLERAHKYLEGGAEKY